MNIPPLLKNSFYSALVFFGTLLILSAGYAAWNAGMSKVGNGSGLTSNGWNALVDNISDLDSRWSRVSGGIAFTGGNVGIGTGIPGTTLDVNGSISSQGPAGEASIPSSASAPT